MIPLEPGKRVRVKKDPGRIGILTGKKKERGDLILHQVFFPDTVSYIPEDQIECLPDISDPVELLASGKLGRVADLRRNLTHIRLSGKLANLIYSMDTTNTDFYPYQFKPVIKFLNAPSNGMLIADEVGLGKTIEAGLIWTELRSRFDFRRLMVLCPAMLREKWQEELNGKFGIKADIQNAKEILLTLKRSQQDGSMSSFAVIGSLQGLRPPRSWKSREENKERDNIAARLAAFLDERADEEPLIDLLIIDEAHYMRNADTATSQLGRLLRHVTEYIILLSATPVHLKSGDLYQLLNLVDEDTFHQPSLFDEILQANAPLIEVRDAVMARKVTPGQIKDLLEAAVKHPYLQGNRQLRSLLSELPGEEQLSDDHYRSQFAYRLETMNLLGHVVTRTRKREVTEWRVMREAVPEVIQFTPQERQFYNGVTNLVRKFCMEYEKHEGFLLVMPQRQIASSMAAALREWQNRSHEYDEQLYEDFGPQEEQNDTKHGPVVTEIMRQAYALADLQDLIKNDSKYNRLLSILSDHLKKYPDEKIVLFSYFRPTLKYLKERLTQDGIRAIILMGGDKDKSGTLREFKSKNGPNLLLSSEVGSEGIDLQFARIVINYDLPWNPMRVEQRIGRLDRLGQKSSKILIWNLFAEDTIDARIYECLYKRIDIFEKALGGLEVILGEEIQKLTLDLLSGYLTPEQESTRIEQTALALANIRHQEDQLEEQSANLVALGDYVMNQIKAARELNRLISAYDLWIYVHDFFQKYYQGCEFRQQTGDDINVAVLLSSEARYDLEEYTRNEKISHLTHLTRASSVPVLCRFENRVTMTTPGKVELISQFHPLVRFVSHRLRELEESYYPAVSISVHHNELPQVEYGIYIFTIQRWSSSGLQEREQVFFSASNISKRNKFLHEDDAEKLVTTAALHGHDWLEASNLVDCAEAAKIAEHLLTYSDDRYANYVRQKEAENNDRADLQEKTLDQHLANQLNTLEGIRTTHLQNNRLSLTKATEAKMNTLKEKVKQRKLQIKGRRELKSRKDEMCIGLIEVA
jgi:superfamily II DNA or RNA helicase